MPFFLATFGACVLSFLEKNLVQPNQTKTLSNILDRLNAA